ncbi:MULTISPECIES: helix-turn-helix domain-containing protein [unclassified Coleofasciculus]|uniref:helix-turn-helix domain-containing protein n=1 Tax=unclassified Coleofasciculus TaxID=2692782 RepID=UPI0018812195|nr:MULTISPECIES: helix-turn-helix domain-containing protein [unclassified Coleofasciculus]MBE9127776.1 helix-turn-helix domain-containing protein [Coleofasciculus sp. LEGE 07081]MBE9148589.1 helix-turn-helix domain-containing protein [Coleofasciculus sp. LEGE 07092]
MSGVLKINITESPETLHTLLAKQKTAQGKERIQALYLLKTGQVETIQHLALVLGRARTTVQRWLRHYRQEGLTGLLRVQKSPGRPPSLPDWAVERLRQELTSTQFTSYNDIKIWLETNLGVEASYKVVHSVVRYQLQFNLKLDNMSPGSKIKS